MILFMNYHHAADSGGDHRYPVSKPATTSSSGKMRLLSACRLPDDCSRLQAYNCTG